MNPENMLRAFGAIIITGGSSGIGKAFLEHIHTVNPELPIFNLSRTIPDFQGMPKLKLILRHVPCDFTDRGQLEDACVSLVETLGRELPSGRILLINNSGYGTYGSFPKPDLARNLEMLDVNVRAPVALTGFLLPLLRERGGAIINVASTAAFQAIPGMANYAATKAFLLHWSLALSVELRPAGVSVLAVCPGPTRTRFFANAGMGDSLLPRFAGQQPDQVVRGSLTALAKGRSLHVSGWKNKLTVAAVSVLPKTFAARAAGWVVGRLRPTGA